MSCFKSFVSAFNTNNCKLSFNTCFIDKKHYNGFIKLKGGTIKMKWSFEEEVIVCKFYLSHVNTWREQIHEVMFELKNAGFVSRDESSVKMRIQNVQYLHVGIGLSNVAKQTKSVYGAFAHRLQIPAFSLELQEFIKNSFKPIHADLSNVSLDPSFVPLEPIGPSFRELLFNFIDERGMKDSDVYNSCFVGRDTFSHIRKGDRGVSKKTIIQLCFGLKLSYEESVLLLSSAEFAFSNNSVFDLVIIYFLKNRNYDIFAANAELYDRNEKLLF